MIHCKTKELNLICTVNNKDQYISLDFTNFGEEVNQISNREELKRRLFSIIEYISILSKKGKLTKIRFEDECNYCGYRMKFINQHDIRSIDLNNPGLSETGDYQCTNPNCKGIEYIIS